jgi:hypothetical protein
VEDHGEYPHGEERANHRPGEANSGLLVAHQDMPPGQAIEQLAGAPPAVPVVVLGVAGFENEFGHGETVRSQESGVIGMGEYRPC